MRTFSAILALMILVGCQDKATDAPSSSIPVARQEQLRMSILASAGQMQDDFVKGNLDGFVSYIYPDIVEMMGGAEKVKESMGKDLPELAKTIEKTYLGKDFEIVEDSNRLCAILPVETVYSFPDGKMVQKTYRIACSTNNGSTWTFIDGQCEKDQEKFIQDKFPALTKRVPFPKCINIRLK